MPQRAWLVFDEVMNERGPVRAGRQLHLYSSQRDALDRDLQERFRRPEYLEQRVANAAAPLAGTRNVGAIVDRRVPMTWRTGADPKNFPAAARTAVSLPLRPVRK